MITAAFCNDKSTASLQFSALNPVRVQMFRVLFFLFFATFSRPENSFLPRCLGLFRASVHFLLRFEGEIVQGVICLLVFKQKSFLPFCTPLSKVFPLQRASAAAYITMV